MIESESTGLRRLVEMTQECKLVDLIALQRFGLEDAWLQPGEHFQCEWRMAADIIKAGLAERAVNLS
jgi:hypothetical protein